MSIEETRFTIAGTDINDVKRRNQHSGLSYNEVKALLAETYLKAKEKHDERK